MKKTPMISLIEQATRRVENSDALEPYRDIILYDWPEGEEHLEWIVTADESEILEWASIIRDGEPGFDR